MKQGKGYQSFAKRMHWSQQIPSSNNTEDSTHGHYQVVDTEIRLTVFFAAKDGEALCSQQKQDLELTVAQIMNVVYYSHFLKNFPKFVVIHTGKGFSVVNEAEVDVFLEFPCFLYEPTIVGNLISGFSAFSKLSLCIWKFLAHVLLKANLKDFEHNLINM